MLFCFGIDGIYNEVEQDQNLKNIHFPPSPTNIQKGISGNNIFIEIKSL